MNPLYLMALVCPISMGVMMWWMMKMMGHKKMDNSRMEEYPHIQQSGSSTPKA